MKKTTIGILALQGAFREHVNIMGRLGANAVEVRKPEQLENVDGLIIPGGESTSMGLIAERWGMVQPLREWVHGGRPTWGTCAGMILLAERATSQKKGGQPLLGGLNVTVDRNYFGRQVNSFETLLNVSALGDAPFPAVFIRAPAIVETEGDISVLARVDTSKDANVICAVQQGPILATAFHPELTNDYRWHSLFLEMVTTPQVAAAADSTSANEK